jgi:hypothetical protein
MDHEFSVVLKKLPAEHRPGIGMVLYELQERIGCHLRISPKIFTPESSRARVS